MAQKLFKLLGIYLSVANLLQLVTPKEPFAEAKGLSG